MTKRRAAARREAKKTGVGINSVPPLNAEEEKALSMLGPEALEGILGGIDVCACALQHKASSSLVLQQQANQQ